MGQETLRLSAGEDYIGVTDIAQRVAELGNHFTEYYKNAEEVLAVVLMQGAMFFAADLIRAIDHPNIILDTIRAKSYEGTESTDEILLKYMTDHEPAGKHILLIEDILDKGTTLSRMTKMLRSHNPASIAVVSMFEKPECRLPDTELAVDDLQIGMQIANEFVLGYGLDWKDKYRHLRFVTKAIETTPRIFAPLVSVEPAQEHTTLPR